MSNYCVTFRIADRTVNGKTYDDRRNLLMENARTEGKGFWQDTTSFLLAESYLNTSAYAAKVFKGLSAQYDMVFVFDTSDQSGNYFGAIDDEHEVVLKSFFPLAYRLP